MFLHFTQLRETFTDCLCDYLRPTNLKITLYTQHHRQPVKVNPRDLNVSDRQTDSIGPTHFSSSTGMSVPSHSPHSPVKQMSAPKETHCVFQFCLGTQDLSTASVNINRTMLWLGRKNGDHCILVLFCCSKSKTLRIVK